MLDFLFEIFIFLNRICTYISFYTYIYYIVLTSILYNNKTKEKPEIS